MWRSSASILMLWLAGCAFLPGPVNRGSIQTYVLMTEEAGAWSSVPGRGPRVRVSPPQAWPGYNSPRIAYVKRPYEVSYYAYNEWVDTPSRLIEPLLIRALERSGLFSAVLPESSSGAAGLRLDTEIVSFHHEYLTNPSQGRVALHAQLVDLTNGDILGTKTFEAVTPAASPDPYGGVKAISGSLERVLSEIVAFCRKAIKGG
jgi:cholesterol transport system auxiliary component